LRAELGPGSLSHVAINLDRLLPSVRVGAFVSKGIKDSDVVGASTTLGLIHERVMHTVDTAGLNVQANIVPSLWWLDAHAELLKRYAPGVGNTAGGALRVSRQFQPWLVGFGQVDVNESFISAHIVGTVTFGVSLGHWPRPSDFSNPVNPLGSLIPPVHYEVFDRVR